MSVGNGRSAASRQIAAQQFSTLLAFKDRKIVKAFLYLQSFLTDGVFEYTKVTFLWRL
jgi:hypothetical protein